MFHTTSVVKHLETIGATLMLNYCNICWSIQFFLKKIQTSLEENYRFFFFPQFHFFISIYIYLSGKRHEINMKLSALLVLYFYSIKKIFLPSHRDSPLCTQFFCTHYSLLSKMHCGYMNLQCCVKQVYKLRNRTSSPSNLRTRSPRSSPVLHGTVRPGFAVLFFPFSNLFRLNL